MSDAFFCDDCGEYSDGSPAEKLYVKRYHDRQGSETVLRAELCASCSESFAGGPEDDDAD
jgi:hypothetical protein